MCNPRILVLSRLTRLFVVLLMILPASVSVCPVSRRLLLQPNYDDDADRMMIVKEKLALTGITLLN